MKYTSNERGAVPILVALLLVALVAVIGFAVYNSTQHKDAQTTSVSPSPESSPASTASPAATPTAMLTIKELGIEVPLNNGPSDLRYTFAHNNDLNADTAQLGTAKCHDGSLGEIIKVSGTIPSNVKAYTTSDLTLHLKQYNGFYLQHVPSQNGCSDTTALRQTIQAVNSLQLIQ